MNDLTYDEAIERTRAYTLDVINESEAYRHGERLLGFLLTANICERKHIERVLSEMRWIAAGNAQSMPLASQCRHCAGTAKCDGGYRDCHECGPDVEDFYGEQR